MVGIGVLLMVVRDLFIRVGVLKIEGPRSCLCAFRVCARSGAAAVRHRTVCDQQREEDRCYSRFLTPPQGP